MHAVRYAFSPFGVLNCHCFVHGACLISVSAPLSCARFRPLGRRPSCASPTGSRAPPTKHYATRMEASPCGLLLTLQRRTHRRVPAVGRCFHPPVLSAVLFGESEIMSYGADGAACAEVSSGARKFLGEESRVCWKSMALFVGLPFSSDYTCFQHGARVGCVPLWWKGAHLRFWFPVS